MDKLEIDLYLQCPKCLKRLELKEEGWYYSTPYCKHCDTEYDIIFKSKEMKITFKEK